MIVRRIHEHLQLITQPDHAHLAAAIMTRSVPLAARSRSKAILHAIREHDNGWAEADAAPTVDPTTGEIHDFVNVPVARRHAVWPRGIARLEDDPWAAALVAHHAITVYDRFRSDREWTSFFAEMEAARDTRLQPSGLPFQELADDYQFLRVGDLISLAFCTGTTAEQRFGDWTVRLSGTHVEVAPGAFDGSPIPIDITARQIRDRRFQSDADLREALRDAKTIVLRGNVA